MTHQSKPVLKWAGGKTQILLKIQELFPETITSYCEPFLGGGAVAFYTMFKDATLADINEEVITFYKVVRDNASELISLLSTYKNEEEFYYALRALDRDSESFAKLSDVQRAARTYFLNRTCFNGLYRVNPNGQFNVPFGKYKKEFAPDTEAILNLSFYLNEKKVKLLCADYKTVLSSVKKDTFVYLDPPYYPVSATSKFTNYSSCGFSEQDQVNLCTMCESLDKKGIRFMLSNSCTPPILDLYRKFNIHKIEAIRRINSIKDKRGPVKEVIVTNYDTNTLSLEESIVTIKGKMNKTRLLENTADCLKKSRSAWLQKKDKIKKD